MTADRLREWMCQAYCPTVRREGEPWTHAEEHRELDAVLTALDAADALAAAVERFGREPTPSPIEQDIFDAARAYRAARAG